nr:hypothetical protein Iba_chr04bCG5250 [Ipomoea batatas]
MRNRQRLCTRRRPWRHLQRRQLVFRLRFRQLLAATVKRDHRCVRHFCLANRALEMLIRTALNIKPLIDAGPAIEMAAECDHWIAREVEANVTVEAGRSLLRRIFYSKRLRKSHELKTIDRCEKICLNTHTKCEKSRSDLCCSELDRRFTPVFNSAPAPLESFIFFNLIPLEARLCLRRVCSLPQLHRPPIVDSLFTAPPSSTRPATLAAAQLRIFSAIEFDTEENCWLNKGHYLA